MSNTSPIPGADPTLLVWFDNFSSKLPAVDADVPNGDYSDVVKTTTVP